MDHFWPERVAVFLVVLIGVALLLLGTPGNPNAGSDAWVSAWLAIVGHLSLVVVLPIWLLLRGFDICFIDHRRRTQ